MCTSRISGRGWAIFAVCSLGFLISMFYRMSVTVISVPLARDLGLTTSDLGTISAVFFFAFSLSQLPLGPILDRLGVRWPMTILMLLGACGSVVFALSGSMAQAVAGRILLGVGMCPGMMGSFTLMAYWFPAHSFGTMTGFFMAVGVLGNMLASTPLALMAQKTGWRGAFLIVAVINLIQAAAFFWIVRDRPEGVSRPAASQVGLFKDLASLWRRPSYLTICLTLVFPLRVGDGPAGALGRAVFDLRPGIFPGGHEQRGLCHRPGLHSEPAPHREIERLLAGLAQMGGGLWPFLFGRSVYFVDPAAQRRAVSFGCGFCSSGSARPSGRGR